MVMVAAALSDAAGVELELDDEEDEDVVVGVVVEPPSPQAATVKARITRQSNVVQRVMRRDGETNVLVIEKILLLQN